MCTKWLGMKYKNGYSNKNPRLRNIKWGQTQHNVYNTTDGLLVRHTICQRPSAPKDIESAGGLVPLVCFTFADSAQTNAHIAMRVCLAILPKLALLAAELPDAFGIELL